MPQGWTKVPDEVTHLSPVEEAQFRRWAATNKLADVDHPDSHYDYRGFWKETQGAAHPPGSQLHFPDTYKQHGHPTFSVESKYSTGPEDGGTWQGDTFRPSLGAAAWKPVADSPSQGPDWSMAPTFGGLVGGIGGGLLGGPPGAIAGAAAGGGLGEWANNRFGTGEQPSSAADQAIRVGVGGLKQGLLEAIPFGIGKLFAKGATPAMEMGLHRTAADKLAFPNAAKRLVTEGIIPRGQKVQNALSAAEGRVNTATQTFDRIHPVGPVDPDAIAQSAYDFAHQQGRIGGLGNVSGPETVELKQLKQAYQDQNTRSRSLGETVDQKRAYQARAKYSSRPNAPPVTSNTLNFNEGVAGANRREAIRLDPALEGELSREQDLMGALGAQQKAEVAPMPLSYLGAAQTITGLRNPTAMGITAISLDRLGKLLQHPMTPAAIRLAISQFASRPRTISGPGSGRLFSETP